MDLPTGISLDLAKLFHLQTRTKFMFTYITVVDKAYPTVICMSHRDNASIEAYREYTENSTYGACVLKISDSGEITTIISTNWD